eukprot:SAG11_NODE_14580_length_607_cov_0.797244_1_plen_158_part_10
MARSRSSIVSRCSTPAPKRHNRPIGLNHRSASITDRPQSPINHVVLGDGLNASRGMKTRNVSRDNVARTATAQRWARAPSLTVTSRVEKQPGINTCVEDGGEAPKLTRRRQDVQQEAHLRASIAVDCAVPCVTTMECGGQPADAVSRGRWGIGRTGGV